MKVCLEDGCWQPTANTRCPDHERAWQRARNATPKRAAYRAHKRKPVPPGQPCLCCGTIWDMTWHHIEPLAAPIGQLGGGMVPLCRPCNSSIGAKRMEGFTCPKHGGVEA